MDRLIHTSLAALRGAMARQTATANNLANVSTTGFRADLSAAQSLWMRGDTLATRATMSEGVRAADLSAGTVSSTGRELDVALAGQAFLAVQADDGSEVYSRRGDLTRAPSGLLTNGDGAPVLGEAGPITLPPADSVRIGEDGAVWIIPPGGDPATPQRVDRLKLVSLGGAELTKGVDNLLRAPEGTTLPDDPDARLIPRSLEGSNVEPTQALVAMIEASRSWDTQMRLISTARDLGSATADLMQLPN